MIVLGDLIDKESIPSLELGVTVPTLPHRLQRLLNQLSSTSLHLRSTFITSNVL